MSRTTGFGHGINRTGTLGTSARGIGGAERLLGALQGSDSAAHVMTEALHALIEARFLVVTGHQSDAVAVLDKGIGELRYALNLSDVEPE